eukprot:6157183-Pleurochrysis_carterae.AAC.1
MVSHVCIASHAYSRSARAPLPKLLGIRSRWPPLPRRATLLELPRRRAVGASAAPAPALAPTARRIVSI